jgi:hypothetical protein
MEWISVDDRLPEEDKPIIVFGKDGAEIYSGFHVMDFNNYYKDVTHWMPLPSPPEAT